MSRESALSATDDLPAYVVQSQTIDMPEAALTPSTGGVEAESEVSIGGAGAAPDLSIDHSEALSEYVFASRYARMDYEKGRRETWEEAVRRTADFLREAAADREYDLTEIEYEKIYQFILEKKVMPSMRLLSTSPACKKSPCAAYNCASMLVDRVKAFPEALYLLACGVGVAFSIERQYIARLDIIPPLTGFAAPIRVRDSKIGWASAFEKLLTQLYQGIRPTWDMAMVRPAGSPLRTFGGVASGPEPLNKLFTYTVKVFESAVDRRLESVEAHDIMCNVADCIISGGRRRSAMLSMSNRSDDRARVLKSGQWYIMHPERANANNSVAYTEKPPPGIFMREWLSLYDSKSGERGIFSRYGARRKLERIGRRSLTYSDGTAVPWMTNVCGEVILRPCQFCNLTEVVCRVDDTEDSLTEKVHIAALIGTIQASLTNFRYLDPVWQRNAEEEALLGVSLTGIQDCPILGCDADPRLLQSMYSIAIDTNAHYASLMSMNPAAAVTCVKPSGTVSQLVNSASGIHPRHAPFYIRRVRESVLHPICKFLIDQGVPHEPSAMKDSDMVFSFPIRAPVGAKLRSELSAVDMLNAYLRYNGNWADHSVSITINVREDEWVRMAAEVYEHFDQINGATFFPYDDSVYLQAPYEEITEEQYNEMSAIMPVIDWSRLSEYETEDRREMSRTFACAGGGCDL